MDDTTVRESISRKKVAFEPSFGVGDHANIDLMDRGPKPLHGQCELIPLTHLIKRRLRNIIRRLRSTKFRLHYKRVYKRKARARKLFRRSEFLRKFKQAEKEQLKNDGKSAGKGQEKSRSPKPGASAPKPIISKTPNSYHKWQVNKFRKWRRIRMRAKFTKAETRRHQFAIQNPGTRPFSRRDFGWSKNQEQVHRLHRHRLSYRWYDVMFPQPQQHYFRALPKINPYMRPPKGQTDPQIKKHFRQMLTTEWQINNFDRLNKNRMLKAVVGLILAAKERYDQVTSHKVSPPTMTRSPSRSGRTPEKPQTVESDAKNELQANVQNFLRQDFAKRMQILQNKTLPRILHDKDIRRNTFINRPKLPYDMYLRRKIQSNVIGKYRQQRHLLQIPASGKVITQNRRMPLPFRRYIVPYQRPSKTLFSSAQIHPAYGRFGSPPAQPLDSILPYPRERVKMPKNKRPKYQKFHDSHNLAKEVIKHKKKKKSKKDKEVAEVKPAAAFKIGKPAKGQSARKGKGPPPNDPKKWKSWHRKQKQHRRRQKLRRWIHCIEKRRRILITREIKQEANFKGRRNLRAMRTRVCQLEEQADKANQLIAYLTRRNDFVKEQYKDVYSRKYSGYFGQLTDWRTQNGEWHHLSKSIDQIKTTITAQTAIFMINCDKIMAQTTAQEEAFAIEIANFESDYTEIIDFIRLEPHWAEEIQQLERKPLYYDFLYEFREATESASLADMSELLRRIMQKDLMQLAHQERRRMRQQLPGACKRMLDERGLLAQEENKLRIWCNRLQRRRDKLTIPTIQQLYQQTAKLRHRKRTIIANRQPVLKTVTFLLNQLRRSQAIKLSNFHGSMKREQERWEKTTENFQEETDKNEKLKEKVTLLQKKIGQLQELNAADFRLRKINCNLIFNAAKALKDAFQIPQDLYQTCWPSVGCQEKPVDVDASLQHVLQMIRSVKDAKPSDSHQIAFNKASIYRK